MDYLNEKKDSEDDETYADVDEPVELSAAIKKLMNKIDISNRYRCARAAVRDIISKKKMSDDIQPEAGPSGLHNRALVTEMISNQKLPSDDEFGDDEQQAGPSGLHNIPEEPGRQKQKKGTKKAKQYWLDHYYKYPKFDDEDKNPTTHEEIIQKKKLRSKNRYVIDPPKPGQRVLRSRSKSTLATAPEPISYLTSDDSDDDDDESLVDVERSRKSSKRKGSGLMKYNDNTKEYIYWDDPNELVDRLRLLLASRAAGHTGHTNEITSIIEELQERDIIY